MSPLGRKLPAKETFVVLMIFICIYTSAYKKFIMKYRRLGFYVDKIARNDTLIGFMTTINLLLLIIIMSIGISCFRISTRTDA